MKIIKLLTLGITLFLSAYANAQVSVNVNIGSPPLWGPVGYTEVRYYYLPDVEAYYDIHSSMFIYYGGGAWIYRAYLPTMYSHYDLYTGYKVVMTDYHGTTPYTNHNKYKTKYKKGYRGESQKTIGAKPGNGSSNGKASSKGSPNKQTQGNTKGGSNENGKGAKPAKGNGGGNGKKK